MFKKPATQYIIVDSVYIEWAFFNKFVKCVVLKLAFFFSSSEMTCINSMGSVFTLLILKISISCFIDPRAGLMLSGMDYIVKVKLTCDETVNPELGIKCAIKKAGTSSEVITPRLKIV